MPKGVFDMYANIRISGVAKKFTESEKGFWFTSIYSRSCKPKEYALIRLSGRKGRPGPSLSTYAPKGHFHMTWGENDHITITRLFKYIEKILQPEKEKFQIKNSDIFLISVQNIDCWYSLEPPRRGDSNEYPQSMFLSRNKKNNVYPCKPQFYYIKVGFKVVKII